jgi:hypothetical protein
MNFAERHKPSGPDAPALELTQTSIPREVWVPNQAEPSKYPLLEEILAGRQMTLQPMYTIRDIAKLFGVSVRAIQTYVASGKLASRDLPGRAKFLSADLEQFLRESRKGGRR